MGSVARRAVAIFAKDSQSSWAQGTASSFYGHAAVIVSDILWKFAGYETVAEWIRTLPIEVWHAFGGTRKSPYVNAYRRLMNQVCPKEL